MTINADTLEAKLKAIQTENEDLAKQSSDLSRQQAAIVVANKRNGSFRTYLR